MFLAFLRFGIKGLLNEAIKNNGVGEDGNNLPEGGPEVSGSPSVLGGILVALDVFFICSRPVAGAYCPRLRPAWSGVDSPSISVASFNLSISFG
jgi:hypothetical protein